MQIKGADGYSPEMIRDEVERGGRLVIYVYCVSIVLMTFKRPTDIHFIRAGQSPVARGLPFTFVTLLFGWWGFPWGPIYSIESLYKNLRGGIDVTDEVLANLFPRPTPPPIYSSEYAAATGTADGGYHNSPSRAPSHAASRAPLPPRKPAFTLTPRFIAIGAAAVVALAFTIFAASSHHAGQHLPVTIVNGLPTRTSFQINDQTVVVAPLGQQTITLPEGDIRVGPAAGQPAQTLHVETDFWTRLFSPKIAVINPDRLALLESQNVIYQPKNSTNDYAHLVDWKLLANESVYLLPEPDYAFVEPPENHTVPKGEKFAKKSYLSLVTLDKVSSRLGLVKESLNADAAKTYATNLALALPDSLVVPQAVLEHLTPKEALTVVEPRLADRPFRVEWHRAYQSLAEAAFPDIDVKARYADLVANNPDDGHALYLLARIETDPAKARRDYDRALAAATPCPYAHLGLGYLDTASARFQDALAHYDAVLATGLPVESAREGRREMLTALRRHDELAKDLAARRAADPSSVLLMAEELRFTATVPNATSESIDALMKRCIARCERESSPDQKQLIRPYFDAQLAYALGDEARFARSSEELKGPRASFEAAISRRDHVAAKLAVKEAAELPAAYYLELYLVAAQKRDPSSAATYWAGALEALGNSGKGEKIIAQHLVSDAPLNLELLRTTGLSSVQKALLFTSLGLQKPAHRTTLFAWAAQHNYSHEFPSLLIDSVLRTTQQKMDMSL